MAGYGSDLVDEACDYIVQSSLNEESARLNLSIANELVIFIDKVVEKTGRSRSFVVEQLLFHSLGKFSASNRLL
jgi:hypothetical protein